MAVRVSQSELNVIIKLANLAESQQGLKQLEAVGAAAGKKVGSSFSDAASQLRTAGLAVASLAAAFVGVSKSLDTLAAGGRLMGVRAGFEAIGGTKRQIDELNAAIGNSASKLDLMRLATRGAGQGLAQLQIKELAIAADQLASAMGQDFLQVFDQLTLAVGTGSVRAFRTLGVDVRKLEEQFGTGKVAIEGMIEAATSLATAVGPDRNRAGDAVEGLRNAMKDLKLELAETAAQMAADRGVLSGIEGLAKRLRDVNQPTKDATVVIVALGTAAGVTATLTWGLATAVTALRTAVLTLGTVKPPAWMLAAMRFAGPVVVTGAAGAAIGAGVDRFANAAIERAGKPFESSAATAARMYDMNGNLIPRTLGQRGGAGAAPALSMMRSHADPKIPKGNGGGGGGGLSIDWSLFDSTDRYRPSVPLGFGGGSPRPSAMDSLDSIYSDLPMADQSGWGGLGTRRFSPYISPRTGEQQLGDFFGSAATMGGVRMPGESRGDYERRMGRGRLESHSARRNMTAENAARQRAGYLSAGMDAFGQVAAGAAQGNTAGIVGGIVGGGLGMIGANMTAAAAAGPAGMALAGAGILASILIPNLFKKKPEQLIQEATPMKLVNPESITGPLLTGFSEIMQRIAIGGGVDRIAASAQRVAAGV